MHLFSIFDDFDAEAGHILRDAGIELSSLSAGEARPAEDALEEMLLLYDGILIGTGQKLGERAFKRVETAKIIGTASAGTDHIRVPEEKKRLVRVFSTQGVNAVSVAEYTMGMFLACSRRLAEGCAIYCSGQDNKALSARPAELYGKTLGVIGAGHMAQKVMDYAKCFGMRIICWTRTPDEHKELVAGGITFVSLEQIARESDFISVNLPGLPETKQIISSEFIRCMKPDAVFVSISRIEVIDLEALLDKVRNEKDFYAVLDIDADRRIAGYAGELKHLYVTPHIAGGTVESRQRMFLSLAQQIAKYASENG